MGHIPPISMQANATIGANLIVTPLTSTAHYVKVPASAAEVPIGITIDNADTDNAIPISGPGTIARLYFNDTVTTGKFVASNNAGQGVPHVDITAGSYVVGILIGPTVAATGTIAKVLVQPMFKSIP